MKIPESISAMVYSMKHPALWTLMVWAIAAVGYWLMATVGNVPVAFLYLASIVFVGAMPLIKGKHNTLHWICGITGCAASQLWCVLTCVTTEGYMPVVAAWICVWALYAAIMLCARFRHWCFWMEVWCMASVVIVLNLYS